MNKKDAEIAKLKGQVEALEKDVEIAKLKGQVEALEKLVQTLTTSPLMIASWLIPYPVVTPALPPPTPTRWVRPWWEITSAGDGYDRYDGYTSGSLGSLSTSELTQ